MGILFLILKILLFLLLALLGLILLILFLVLLVPVRYRAGGSCLSGRPDGLVQVSWLLHVLLARAVYAGGELSLTVRVLGFRVLQKSLFGGEPENGQEQKDGEPPSEPKAIQNAEKKQEGAAPGAGEPEKPVKPEEPEEPHKPVGKPEPEEPPKAEKTPQPAKPPGPEEPKQCASPDDPGTASGSAGILPQKGRLARLLEKIRVTADRICAKLKEAKEQKDRILAFAGNEANQKTFRLLARQVFRLLRHILPYRADGRVRFGFDDPYTTGQVLQYISPFYALYAKRVEVTPVFGEKVLEGELSFRGRIRAGTVLVFGVRILLDKNFRRLIRRRER